MIGKSKKILFVSHDASRTGAPMVLLHLLKWIKANTDTSFSILLLGGGDLEEEFEKIGEVYTWYRKSDVKENRSFILKNITRLKNRVLGINVFRKQVLTTLIHQQFDLLYINTIAAYWFIPLLKQSPALKTITHVHELEWLMKTYYSQFITPGQLAMTNRFIAVSAITQDNLVSYGVKKEDIRLVYEFVDVHAMRERLAANSNTEPINKESKKGFLVGGCGAMQWRKGTDLFFELSWYLQKLRPEADISFVWIGEVDKAMQEGYYYETKKLGLQVNVSFTGMITDPFSMLQKLDVFALTSREDPFPLVCLEAACAGVPIVCFNGAGGIPELVEQGAGMVVPYRNIDAMAKSILDLLDDVLLRENIKAKTAEVLKQYDTQQGASSIYNLISELI